MVRTATKNSDWLQNFKEDYKSCRKFLKTSSPKEIISKITISDETVSSFEEYQESDLLRDYYIKNEKDLDILSNKVFKLKEYANRFDDKYLFLGFIYRFNKLLVDIDFLLKSNLSQEQIFVFSELAQILGQFSDQFVETILDLMIPNSRDKNIKTLSEQINKYFILKCDDVEDANGLEIFRLRKMSKLPSTRFKVFWNKLDQSINVKHLSEVISVGISCDEKFLFSTKAQLLKFEGSFEHLALTADFDKYPKKLLTLYGRLFELEMIRFDESNEVFDIRTLLSEIFSESYSAIWVDEFIRHLERSFEVICQFGIYRELSDASENDNNFDHYYVTMQTYIKFGFLSPYSELKEFF